MSALYKDPNVGGLVEVEPSQEEKPWRRTRAKVGGVENHAKESLNPLAYC
jgi:hypothetical protein